MARVLVVDDVEIVFSAFTEDLASGDFQIDTALSGESALEKAKSTIYDIIFIDLFMPGKDGIQTCKALHEISPESKLVAFTGNIYTGLINKEIEFKMAGGEIHFLYKPFLKGEIRKIAQHLIQRSN